MTPRVGYRCLFCLFCLLIACVIGAEGAWAHGGGSPPPSARRDAPMPYPSETYGNPAAPQDDGLPGSVRRIQRETGGQVLRAQPYERDGREVYRVKVLTPQGRIRVYEDDSGGPRPPPQVYSRPEPVPAREAVPNYPRPQLPTAPPPRERPSAYPRAPSPPAYEPQGHHHGG